MYFSDYTGHTFFQRSFNYRPIGYEYYQNKYTFWIDNKEHSYCSINNYYIRPIYILLDNSAESIEISIESGIFSLISSKNIAEKFINGTISLDENDIVKELIFNNEEDNDILEIPVMSSNVDNDENITKYMYPFYVIGNSSDVGTFLTNILIHVEYDDSHEWCPITVGGEFNEENEILYINGRNMGVNLPHEIIRAVYNASYINDVFDEDLYNEKLKEYLIEYMSIRGEIGNYKSAINSLKWFGWGDKVELVSLLRTDNQFMTQFIRDYFDTESDIIESFKHFVNTTLLSLVIWENKENGEYNDYDLEADFIGENQPVLEDLFSKQVKVLYGGLGEETYYYRTYYNFVFGELLFKIAALKFYYEKYFLPVHLSIHNASLHHKVYANDIKFLNRSSISVVEPIVKMGIWKDPFVQFPKDNEIWLTEQVHIVDELYNEWDLLVKDVLNENSDNYFYIHDTCGNIPIKFINYENEPQLHVHMILEKLRSHDDNVLYINTDIDLLNDSLIIIDVDNREINLNETFISYSNDNGRTYSAFFYGVDNLKNIINTYNRKITDVNFDDNGYYVTINEEKIYLGNEKQKIFIDDELYDYIIVPSINETNVDLFNNIGDCTVDYHNPVLLRLKINNDKIKKCVIINDTETDITDNVNILYSPTSEIFYETDFIFNVDEADKYLSFVLYPKMFNNVSTDIMYNRYGSNLTNNKIDITYFINNRFRLRLLVNNRWHQYDFIVRMPDIQIEFGKLVYKYYDNELKFTTRFNQLNDLSDNSLTFNSFMYEPRLTRMNHINFMEDFLKYLKISSARYIDGSIIPTNEFYYYIDVKFIDDGEEYSQRIYITDLDYGNDLIVPRKYFNYDTTFYLFLDKKLLYIFAETDVNDTYEVFSLNDETLIFENSEEDDELYIDPNNYKKFIYDSDNNQYYVETSEGTIYFDVNESLRSDFNTFASKYIETHNITNNYKYLNQIHVYDLYRLNEHIGNNIIMLNNNIDLMYHGIRFTHKSFLSGNTIDISGNTENLITNSSIRTTNNKSFLSNINDSDYASYVNTYDDLVIYSAYEGDWLRPLDSSIEEEQIQPTGYVYYEKVDRTGKATGEYTTDNISIVTDDIQVYYDEACTIDYKDFSNLSAFNSWLQNSTIYVKNDSNYELKQNANNSNSLYIDRDNIDSHTTSVYFKANIVMINNENGVEQIINPTYSEFCNNIKQHIMNSNEYAGEEYSYKIRIKFYIEQHRIVSNIQRIFEGETETENNKSYIIIHNQKIYVSPFYAEYDGNKDVLFNVISLIQQPGIDWIDINDIDETIYELSDNNDHIELVDIDNINDNDISTLLEHRKILILDVTSRIIETIHQYEGTLSFDDYVMSINDNTEDSTNTIPLTFKIESNALDNDYVDVKTVLRCGYVKDNENHYDYFDDYATFNTVMINENNEYHIDCNNYVKCIVNEEERIYDNFKVFFALVPKTTDNESFNISFNPRISLVYNDYDILEYPSDSFENINYNDESFCNYKINNTVYKYGDCRKSKDVIDLYNEFFEKEEVSFNIDNEEYEFVHIDCKEELNIDKNNVEYDMYLMHNEKEWYILYISKDTCDRTLSLYDYEPIKKEIIFNSNKNKYKLILNSSVKKFLLNRYMYLSKNGKNHFDPDDIIVGKVLNNERLPIDIFKTNKWEMMPASIGVDKNLTTSVSNIDMCIFDVPTYNNEYVKGYYDVTYRYSLDRISTQQYKKYGTIRIG